MSGCSKRQVDNSERRILKSQGYLGEFYRPCPSDHTGTGDRVRRFIAKAKTGQGFTLSVIGGSGASSSPSGSV